MLLDRPSIHTGAAPSELLFYIEPRLGLVRQKNNNLRLVVMPRGLMNLNLALWTLEGAMPSGLV